MGLNLDVILSVRALSASCIGWRERQITLEANEAYYEGRPFLDRLHYRIMTNHQDILAEFEKGTLEDVDLTGQEGTPLSSDARFRFVRKPLLATRISVARHAP